MKEIVSGAFRDLWQNIVFYFTLQFVDPFWWWCITGVLVILAIAAFEILVKFYFADIPWLKKAGGLATFGIILWLIAYARGEKEARAHDAARKPKPKPKPPQETPRFRFPWEQ